VIAFIFLWTATAVLVVWAVITHVSLMPPPPLLPDDRAREILAARYARGELTTKE
jgi:hypothetical protein